MLARRNVVTEYGDFYFANSCVGVDTHSLWLCSEAIIIITISGPSHLQCVDHDCCFWHDVVTGKILRVGGETNNLMADDLVKYVFEIIAADAKEAHAFAGNKIFEVCLRSSCKLHVVDFVLSLLKGMYGLEDARLLWQNALHHFFIIDANASVFEQRFSKCTRQGTSSDHVSLEFEVLRYDSGPRSISSDADRFAS